MACWYYKGDLLYVPVGDHEPDPKWRQRLFGIVGLDEDSITDDQHYLIKGARKLKVKEMMEDESLQFRYLVIDCYSFMFDIGNACTYVPSRDWLVLIDEQPASRLTAHAEYGSDVEVFCENKNLAMDVLKVFRKGIERLVFDHKQFEWREGQDMMDRLENMLKAKGWVTSIEVEYGECCFCEGPCNIQSQCCGKCARKM